MDAKTKQYIIDEAIELISEGDDPKAVIDEVFSLGYAFGLFQGRYDSTSSVK